MMLVFIGLHGAGKSHLAELIKREYGWLVYNKRDLLKELYNHKNSNEDWITWYRSLYDSIGPYAVMEQLLKLIPESGDNTILDSVHNLSEWRAIQTTYHEAILVAVISPKPIRLARNEPEDKDLDIQRVKFWHKRETTKNDCLMAEVDWAFNGAATPEMLKKEFDALLAYLNK